MCAAGSATARSISFGALLDAPPPLRRVTRTFLGSGCAMRPDAPLGSPGPR